MEKQNHVYFRSRSTGKTGWYPKSFAKFGDLEEIDPKTGKCIDCAFQPEEPAVEDTTPDWASNFYQGGNPNGAVTDGN